MIIPLDEKKIKRNNQIKNDQAKRDYANKQDLIEIFVETTNTSNEVAFNYLRESYWNFQIALEKYHLFLISSKNDFY